MPGVDPLRLLPFLLLPSPDPAPAPPPDGAGALAGSRTALRAVEELRRRVERLSLACQALWDLAHPRLGITEKELLDRMEALDLEDGRRDGKVQRKATPCPGCRRMVSPRHWACLFCGAPVDRPPFL